MLLRLKFRSLFLLSIPLAAHELEVTSQLVAPAVIVRATYAGSEPVPFAKIQVYSPANVTQEFQSANTDKRGYFGFVPDIPGSWRVVVDDELGHRKDLAVQVPDPFRGSAAGAEQGGASRLERAILGLALLFGATGFWYGYKRRQMSP